MKLPSNKSSQGSHEDASGVFPSAGSEHSININARGGGEQNRLAISTSAEDLPIDVSRPNPSEYPLNQISKSKSGHIIEVNDTPDGERIMIRHNNGGGIELRDDGSIFVSAMEQKVELIGADHHIVVENDGTMIYKGNLDLKVSGDFNVDCLNYNVNVRGNKTETIKGSDRSRIGGTKGTMVGESMSTTVTEQVTDTFLGGHSHNIKGTHSMNIDGAANYFAKKNMHISSQAELNISADKSRIWSNNLVMMGGSGIIGGQSMVYNGKGAKFTDAVEAPTFHGDLNGTAKIAATSLHQSYADGTGPGYSANTGTQGSITNTAMPTIAEASASNISNYLSKSVYAIRKVNIDVGNFIKRFVNRATDYSGRSKTKMTPGEARSKLRDPANRSNNQLVGQLLKEGVITDKWNIPSPIAMGRIVKSDPTPQVSLGGGSSPTNPAIVYIPAQSEVKIYPDEKYNPYRQSDITTKTLLAPGISMAKFLGSEDSTNLNFLRDLSVKQELAKYLGIHALNMKNILSNQNKFKNVSLKISESVYRPGPSETITDESINDFKLKGRAVVFDVIGNTGKSNLNSLFELAVWWKDVIYYEKLILSYDTIEGLGESLKGRIIVVLPEIDKNYRGTFNRDIETHYNNTVFSKGEFIEIITKKVETNLSSPDYKIPYVNPNGRVKFLNPDPNALPRQIIINALDAAVATLGQGYLATVTFNGGRSGRDAGTQNHPLGYAADFYLSYNGERLYTNSNKEIYDDLIKVLVKNANSKNVRPGIGGYSSFIHYDESPWRQNKPGKAGTWNSGFRILV